MPRLGDWDGTVNGFPASFLLRYDVSLRQRAGIPQYGLSNVVLVQPNACPPSSARYEESVIGGQKATEIGRYGALGLTRFKIDGGFVGAHSATLSSLYNAGSCSGKLNWNMHPATRRPVDDGTWKIHFSSGQSSNFTVLAGGRLAHSIELPNALTACNGLEGAVDLFIAPGGTAKISQSNLKLSVQFARRTAAGQLNAGGSGCADGPIRFTASPKRS